MTTLQTTSPRNTNSASLVLSGAQSGPARAVDAPGFAGVLEAFSNAESSDKSELTDDTINELHDEGNDQLAESDESLDQDSDAQSESNGTSDAQGSASNQGDPNQSTSTADELPAEELDTQINSANDLVKLLNNAAAIDLAGLATQQLTGKAAQSASEAAPQPTPTASPNPPSTQQSAAPQADAGSAAKQVDPSLQSILLQQSRLAQSGQSPLELGSQSPSKVAEAQTIPKQSVQPSDTAQPAKHSIDQNQLIQTSTAVVARSVQASQVIAPQPAQTIDQSAARRKTQSLRSIDEIGVVSKSKPLKGTESTNSNSAGFDLGTQSDRSGQHATRLDAQDPQARTQEQALQRQQVLAQVQRGLASIINTKGGTMKLRMSPEHLGQVKIQLTTKDGHVKIKIDAETEHARSMLKDGLADLRTAMESRGVHVDELSIEQREPNEFRLPTTAGQSNNQAAHSESDANPDRGQSDQHAENQSQEESQENSDNDSPQPIWTELGLDAIA